MNRARPVTTAECGCSPSKPSTVIVLPLPLSPAIPRISPSATAKSTPSTIVTGAVAPGMRIRKPCARRSSGILAPRIPTRLTRGSSTSRRLSPMKLNAITAVRIASPGDAESSRHLN